MAGEKRDKRAAGGAGGSTLGRLRQAARNATLLARGGRLGPSWRSAFEVVLERPNYSLRHYRVPAREEGSALGEPLLLVPPLMVTSEVYDISPDLSAVSWLCERGVDVWLVDFGRPETAQGGMERTLDDHVLAVSEAIDHMNAACGADVHVAGYSQGGMFVYQCAAYRSTRGIASLITFGSPVDIHRALPVHEGITGRLAAAVRKVADGPLTGSGGLPGWLTSTGFKVLSARKEVQQIAQALSLLHDREALRRREPSRRFLGGEGFVAWPAPALREFLDQFVVHNRMTSGGFVIAGRSSSLADIRCPILCFVGLRDDIARPAAVRAIHRAAIHAEIVEEGVQAGHFGLVVGSRALGHTWPSVLKWLEWRTGRQASYQPAEPEVPAAPFNDLLETLGIEQTELAEQIERMRVSFDAELDQFAELALAEAVMEWGMGAWKRAGKMVERAAERVDVLRWQLPRLNRLRRLSDNDEVSLARTLAEQARELPEHGFFVWEAQVYSFAQANARVNRALRALAKAGMRPGTRVGILHDNHPNVLVLIAAANRIGAIPVLLNTGLRGASLAHALEAGGVEMMVCEASRIAQVRERWAGPLYCMRAHRMDEAVPADVVNLEAALAEEADTPPETFECDRGRADELAMLLFTSGTTGLPKAARITNRRWTLAALGAAAAARLTPSDTVYCALPLYHATGLLVACGGALAGGARLALAPKFEPEIFWTDVHRTGATVVFYVGEMCRWLLQRPPEARERNHPIRMFIGNGLQTDVWQQLRERLGRVQVLEFYASTEGNVALANLDGHPVGSVGREMAGSSTLTLLAWDAERGCVERDEEGRVRQVPAGEPGLLVARIDPGHPLSRFEGYTDREATNRKILRDLFVPGDAWFDTGDLLRRDEEGYWFFVDRVGDTWRWRGENVSAAEVERVVHGLPFVARCVAYGVSLPGHEGRAGAVALQLRAGKRMAPRQFADATAANLFPEARPLFVRIVEELEQTATFKPVRVRLVEEGVDPLAVSDALWALDRSSGRYVRITGENRARLLRLDGARPQQAQEVE